MASTEFFKQFEKLVDMGCVTFRIRNGASYFVCNKVSDRVVSSAQEVVMYRTLFPEDGYVVGRYEPNMQISLAVASEYQPGELYVRGISRCGAEILVDMFDR